MAIFTFKADQRALLHGVGIGMASVVAWRVFQFRLRHAEATGYTTDFVDRKSKPAQNMELKRLARRRRDAEACPGRWQQNHGNLLLMFTAILLVVGSLVIAWRQSRPPRTRFPTNAAQGLEEGATAYPTIVLSTEEPRRSVSVRIFGAANDAGIMRIAVYDRPANLSDPEQATSLDGWPIIDGISEGRLEVPPDMGFIAIAAFHDENGNGILDRNALGIPTERYGFSGDVRGRVGPSDFAEAAVRLSDEPIDISIR